MEVPDKMKVSKSSSRKGKSLSTSAREKRRFDDEGGKFEDLILAGFDKMQYPMMRCYIRKFHPVGEATGE